MHTLYDLIKNKAGAWVKIERENSKSVVGSIINYIETKAKLREPQVKAIETYLWLKFVGDNKKLVDIIKDGLIYNKSQNEEYKYITIFEGNPVTSFLNRFSQDNNLKHLQQLLLDDPNGKKANWDDVLVRLLHDFQYTNYLYSLPMGAGKTYLMACFIYLDLFFARNNKDDARFAHNFIVFAPQASKTAILPSLQTIRDFQPEWILPQGEAHYLKQTVHIEILDSLSSQRKDKLQGNNPNLEKVNRLTQTNNFGLVFITNAEKVVLERYDEKDLVFVKSGQTYLGQKETEEIKKSNELREKLSQIPKLGIILDEVHHTYKGNDKEEKKLREAVGILDQHDNVKWVIGMSGTPFIKTALNVGENEIRLNQLQDVVYNYTLSDGIGKFLKIPDITKVEGVRESGFIEKALDEFFERYDVTYKNGTISKLAFYCPSIATLNEEVLTVIRRWYGKNRNGKEDEIFTYYSEVSKQDKKYALPKENLAIFNNLDKPYCKKRVVLLVAVGTEGWDCRSLTGVALPRNTTTTNFVLQTTCRCLREVHDASREHAMIYLGDGNYEILDKQLQDNYKLSIKDLKAGGSDEVPVLVRKPKLGELKYKQIYKKFTIEIIQESINPATQLKAFNFSNVKKKYPYEARLTRGARISDDGLTTGVSEELAGYAGQAPSFEDFVYRLSGALYYRLSEKDLIADYQAELLRLHKSITDEYEWIAKHPLLIYDDVVGFVASCFGTEYKYNTNIITQDAQVQLLEWKLPAGIPYGSGRFLPKIMHNEVARLRKYPERLDQDFFDEGSNTDPQDISFNYAPYQFDSDFELSAMNELLKLAELSGLEFYYNGYRQDRLESFFIQTPLGRYTPDFLIIKRKDGKAYRKGKQGGAIEKILIIETKGKIYYDDDFKAKEKFVVEEFTKHNPQFSYRCFVDEQENNDFVKHLSEVKNLIKGL